MTAGGGKLLPRNTNGSAVRGTLFVIYGRQLINAGTTYEIFRDFTGLFVTTMRFRRIPCPFRPHGRNWLVGLSIGIA